MRFKEFFAGYAGVQRENWLWRVICALLLGVNVLLAAAVLLRREVVVLVPPSLKEAAKISQSKADQKYQEAWALFFALLLGNVTPKNVEFVLKEVEEYLAPAVYHEMLKDIYEQAQNLKENAVSTSFEPHDLSFDAKTGHVLVRGQLTMRGSFGKAQAMPKTFEIGVAIKNYFPQIVYLDAYERQRPEEKADAKKANEKEQKRGVKDVKEDRRS